MGGVGWSEKSKREERGRRPHTFRRCGRERELDRLEREGVREHRDRVCVRVRALAWSEDGRTRGGDRGPIGVSESEGRGATARGLIRITPPLTHPHTHTTRSLPTTSPPHTRTAHGLPVPLACEQQERGMKAEQAFPLLVWQSAESERDMSLAFAPPIVTTSTWAACERCEKWRRLPPGLPPPDEEAPW